jgi:hypothetical protein
MGIALGWVVMALAGVAAAPPPDRNNALITYTFRYVETEGLGWREDVITRLKPVARQGGATIWTAPDDVATRLLASVATSPAAKMLQSPKVKGSNGAPVHLMSRCNRELVTQVSWNAGSHKTTRAPEKVRTGWVATMVGRALDQGVLVRLVLEDTEIAAVHHVTLSEPGHAARPALGLEADRAPNVIVPLNADAASGCVVAAKPSTSWVPKLQDQDAARKSSNESATAGCCSIAAHATNTETKCSASQACCEMDAARKHDGDVAVETVAIDVPEIRSQEIAGEWLIPKDEVLLVSFGAYTVADAKGKAVVKERLALLSAAETGIGSGAERPGRPVVMPITPGPNAAVIYVPPIAAPPVAIAPAPVIVPAPLANLPMPIPSVPSRTMPQGVHVDGTISNLPPLPDEIEPPSSESSEPMPSPQTKKPQQAKPAADQGARKAGFQSTRPTPFSIPNIFLPTTTASPAGLQFMLPIKPFAIKLPFKQKLEIEIFGRVVPDNEPAADSKPKEGACE